MHVRIMVVMARSASTDPIMMKMVDGPTKSYRIPVKMVLVKTPIYPKKLKIPLIVPETSLGMIFN